MKRRENSDSYYQSQNGRSGMDNDANEIKKYFNDLDINITNDFYFLDVGCRAKARTVSFMNEKGANSYGFDIGEQAAKHWNDLEIKNNLKIHNAHDEFNYSFLFDLISISHTLEHCHTPELVLSNINKALKPEGKVWSIVPIEHKDSYHGAHYCIFESHDEHIAMYKSNGFDIQFETTNGANSYLVCIKK